MANTTETAFGKIIKKRNISLKGDKMSGQENQEQSSPVPATQSDDFMDLGDLDFVDHYGEETVADKAELLPENTAQTAINCAFVGIGGGGGKLAKAFLDLGYNRTVLINTTHKDQPAGTSPQHFLLLDGADGVGKDVKAGQQVLSDNATFVEDTLRARLGKVDWLFVCASGGGGTGSSTATLHNSFQRYLDSVQAKGNIVYIVSEPTSQEKLNPTIKLNYTHLLNNVNAYPHIVIDNEKQLQLLRGKVGMLGMYPSANLNFAKMLAQVFKLASESSPIQSFDTQDLEKCLKAKGRLFLGTCAIRDFKDDKLGLKIFKGCSERSPCPAPSARPEVGCLLLVVSTATASDPVASNQIESAISYVGGRSNTLFSGVYVRESIPGVVAICALGGM